MTDKINAILMIEMLGKPEDYVKQIMSEMVDKLGKEKDTRVLGKKISEPKLLDENVYSIFAEVEIETSLQVFMMLIFAYMPSHVEIITPEELKIHNADLNSFFNELTRKLHQYDEIAKTIILERGVLMNKLKELEGKVEKDRENIPYEKIKEKKRAKAGKKNYKKH